MRIARGDRILGATTGLVIVAGIFIGTLFTLFAVPAMYLFLAKDRNAKSNRSTKQPAVQ